MASKQSKGALAEKKYKEKKPEVHNSSCTVPLKRDTE